MYKNFVYVIDLGSDKIYHYQVSADGSTLEQANPKETVGSPGSGPRHMIIDEDLKLAYVLNELQVSELYCGAHATLI